MKANNTKLKNYANRAHGNELLQISSHIRTQSKTMKPTNANWAPDKFEAKRLNTSVNRVSFLSHAVYGDTDFLGFLFLFFCIEIFAGAPCSRENLLICRILQCHGGHAADGCVLRKAF
jgi:hypothetical protein